MTDLTPQMARAVIRGGGFAIGPEGIDYPQDVMAYIDAWEADRKRLAERDSALAQLADCINQELRESGGFNMQVEDYSSDMRPFVRCLVDLAHRGPTR